MQERLDQYIEFAEKTNKFSDAGFYKDVKVLLDAQQAKIDSLMLEFCQEDMTDDQLNEWAKYQIRIEG